MNNSVIKTTGWILMALASALALAADEPAPPSGKRFWFSVGPVARGGMNIEASGSSHVQQEGWHAARPDYHLPGRYTVVRESETVIGAQSYEKTMPDVGPLRGYGDRTYDNGFVNMDHGTADPASVAPGLTWYWGYQEAGQYDPAHQTLAYEARGYSFQETDLLGQGQAVGTGRQRTLHTIRNDAVLADENTEAIGLGFSGGCELGRWGPVGWALAGGMNALWGQRANLNAAPYEEEVHDQTLRATKDYAYAYSAGASAAAITRDTYDLSGTSITPPAAPYAGTYAGPGPLMPNLPVAAQRDTQTSGSTWQTPREELHTQVATRSAGGSIWGAQNQVNIKADMNLLALWLGPRLVWDANTQFRFHLTPAATLNYLEAQAERREEFSSRQPGLAQPTLAAWYEKADDSAWKWGAGVQAGVEVAFAPQWAFGAVFSYDWVAAHTMELGPNTVRFDPSGYMVTASLVRYLGGP